MTQSSIGVALGVGQKTQRQYETNITVPDARYLIAAERIGVDVFYVMFGHRISLRDPRSIEANAVRLAPPMHLVINDESGEFELARQNTLSKKFADLQTTDRQVLLKLMAALIANT